MRRVSVYEYVNEWVWRYSVAKGVVKLVLLAIGRKMEPTAHGYETPPVRVEDLAASTGLVESTIRENLKVLGHATGDLEIVKGRRRGETYRYRLRREPLLPLTDLKPTLSQRRRAAVEDDLSPPDRSGDVAPASAGIRRSHRRETAVPAPGSGGGCAEGLFLSLVQVQVPSTPTGVPVPTEEVAGGFLAWFAAEFKQRRGYAYREANDDLATAKAAELLADHPFDRLCFMAVLMFESTRDRFILDSDYSLHVLHRKAGYLAGLAVERERRAPAPERPASVWDRCPHDPRCMSVTRCAALQAEPPQ